MRSKSSDGAWIVDCGAWSSPWNWETDRAGDHKPWACFCLVEGRALKVKVPDQTPATLDEDAACPSIVSLQGETAVLAWERGGTIVVEGVD